jgi:hypothetical protein
MVHCQSKQLLEEGTLHPILVLRSLSTHLTSVQTGDDLGSSLLRTRLQRPSGMLAPDPVG